VLQAAVRTVDGAEGGSVLVRDGEMFRYRAAVGYDLASLRSVAYSDADMQSWFGGNVEELRRGTPRILTRREMDMAIARQASEAPDALAEAGRLQDIATNLYVPVVYRGDILAVLNLENFSDTEAFGSESVAQARYFCAPVATLLHETHHRMLLAQAARTDALTGLPNRRVFDEGLAAALALADRHGTPFSLLLMDLANFKRINDEAGHGQGDVLLRLFAGRLQPEMRQADLLARWGGDEFTVLLAHTTHTAAVEVARRYARIVESIGIGALSLSVNIGVATCPEDGTDPEELLRVADRRMYAAKAAGTPLMAF
jgi:diguanylate cyclase (GGDEF)-like protein